MAGKAGKEAEEVMLQENALTRLPPAVGSPEGGWWRNVRFLCVSDNELVSLPPTLAGLAQLQELNLNHNRTETLPPDLFAGCARLEVIHLNDNALRALPPSIGQCVALKVGWWWWWWW